ncbi:MAG: iron ABC transporter substrate-binding protein [Actinomycetota bacterium]|nr:iron ABC transporter substrate-binding protein [Actinomycetota bacterium]
MLPRRLVAALTTALLAGLAGCTTGAASGPTDEELVVYSGRNKNLVDPVLQRFAKENGVKVYVRYGGTAELAAQLLEEGERSPADVFFAQDAGALGAIAKAGQFEQLPARTLDAVDERFRARDGRWVGVSGRARVLAYDPRQVPEGKLPDSVLELTEPRWKGKVGFAPSNASFQAFVTGMRKLLGDERTRAWLEGMKANDMKAYDNNVQVLDAVDSGELQLGLINHYYWFEKAAERGESNVHARIQFLGHGDPGALVNVAGVGVLAGSDHADDARKLADYLLSDAAQRYFADTTKEYPLVEGVPRVKGLPAIDSLGAPEIDLADLDSLQETLRMLEEVGLT